jgi:hypothetical protein
MNSDQRWSSDMFSTRPFIYISKIRDAPPVFDKYTSSSAIWEFFYLHLLKFISYEKFRLFSLRILFFISTKHFFQKHLDVQYIFLMIGKSNKYLWIWHKLWELEQPWNVCGYSLLSVYEEKKQNVVATNC